MIVPRKISNQPFKMTAQDIAERNRIMTTFKVIKNTVDPPQINTVNGLFDSIPNIFDWDIYLNHNFLPDSPGVYALLIRFEKEDNPVIAYIGQSQRLCNRLCGHPVLLDLKKQGCIVDIAAYPIKDPLSIEWILISRYKPLLNIRDNG